MSCRPLYTAVAIALAAAGVAHAQERPLPEPKAFLARALANLRSNDLVRSQYRYEERETRYSYGEDGRATKTRVRIYEVTPSPDPEMTYRRLILEDGVEPPDLAKRDEEQRRREREWLARRELEGLDERAARLRKREIEDRKEQAVVDELPLIFDMRMGGRETIDGRPVILFTFAPKPDYEARTPEGGIINHFGGQAWIDEADGELVRLKVEVLRTVSVKFAFLVRLLKGSRGVMERRKIDGGAWLPTYSRFTGSARVMLVRRVDLDEVNEYYRYTKRDADR